MCASKEYWADLKWMEEHYSQLTEYFGKWVCCVNKEIVTSGRNMIKSRKIASKKTGLPMNEIPVMYVLD